MCFKPIESDSIHAFLTPEPRLCNDCFNSSEPILRKFSISGVDGLAIYPYNEFIKSNLYQLKGCYDIELAPIFLEYYRWYLSIKYFGYILVPAPSFSDADAARGFNHVEEIFKSIPNKQYKCIKKTANIKQADLNSKDRHNISKYLAFDVNFEIKNKKILLVDDVFTTGSTMTAMINLIRQQKPKKIKVLVMSMVTDVKNTAKRS